MALNNHVENFTLDMAPGGIAPVLNVSQGDTGRAYTADMYWGGASYDVSGLTVRLRGRKRDNTVFDYALPAPSGTKVSFDLQDKEQVTIIPGNVESELVFTDSDSRVVGTANFVFIVEEAPYDPNAISESDVEGLNDLIEAQVAGLQDEIDNTKISIGAELSHVQGGETTYLADYPLVAGHTYVFTNRTTGSSIGIGSRDEDGNVVEIFNQNVPSNSEYEFTPTLDAPKFRTHVNRNVTATWSVIDKNGLNYRLDATEKTVSKIEPILKETKELVYTTGGYIDLSVSVGSTVNVESIVSSNNYGYIVEPCKAGDVFTVTATGGTRPRAWAFLDSDNKLLSVATGEASVTDMEMTAEQDGFFVSDSYIVSPTVYNASKESYIDLGNRFEEKVDKSNEKAIVYGYSENVNDASLWEQGHIKSTNGTNGDPNSVYVPARIRTKTYIDSNVQYAVCAEGYRFDVFKYEQDGTFVSKSIPLTFFTFDNAYKYRIQIAHSMTDSVSTNIGLSEYNVLQLFEGRMKEWSSLDKTDLLNLNVFPVTGYYNGQSATSTGFDQDTTYSEIISAFDGLVSAHGDYITKTTLGTASDSQTIYKYEVKPTDAAWDNIAKYWNYKAMPKVIIIAGQHGFEKGAVFGLYYFIRDLCENNGANPILDAIKNNVVFEIIPVANPYGFDENSYLNANGVNLNRNYDTSGFPADPSATPGTEQYGGVTPFDQPETQIVRDLVLANLDAFLFFDWHTSGNEPASSYSEIQWLSLKDPTDMYYFGLANAGAKHIRTITEHFSIDYNLNTGGNTCGTITVNSVTLPYASSWAIDQNIIGLTFETCAGFPNRTRYTDEAIKANAEMFGNYLAAVFSDYSK